MISAIHNEISRLFADMSLTAALLITVGFVLLAIEFFQSTRSVAAGCGILLTVCGVTLRMLCGGTEGTLFLLLELFALALYAAHILMLATNKRDWLMQSAYLKVSHVAIDKPLIGRDGVAETDFDKYGRIRVDALSLFALSDAPVRRGDKVIVSRVSGDTIFVVPAPAGDRKETDG